MFFNDVYESKKLLMKNSYKMSYADQVLMVVALILVAVILIVLSSGVQENTIQEANLAFPLFTLLIAKINLTPSKKINF